MNHDEVTFFSEWVRSKLNYPDREADQLAEHIAGVRHALQAGQSNEKTLTHIKTFLDTFVNNFQELEQKTEARQKRNSRQEKKKRQLSIFESKK